MIEQIIQIGPFTTSVTLILQAQGLLAGSIVFFFLARQEKLETAETINFLLFTLALVILNSTGYTLLTTFLKSPGFNAANLGTIFKTLPFCSPFCGGFVISLPFMYLYLRHYLPGEKLLALDLVGTGAALAQVFCWLGCFSSGCGYGRVTSLPWGFTFKYLGVQPHPLHNYSLHPIQLYEAVLNLFSFILLLLVWRKQKFPGQLISLYIINFGAIRFLVDYFRNENGLAYFLGGSTPYLSLSISQVLALVLIGTGLFMYKKLQQSGVRGGRLFFAIDD